MVILVGVVASHSISSLIFISLYANNTEPSLALSRNTSSENFTVSNSTSKLADTIDDNMKCFFLMIMVPEVHRLLRNDFYIDAHGSNTSNPLLGF